MKSVKTIKVYMTVTCLTKLNGEDEIFNLWSNNFITTETESKVLEIDGCSIKTVVKRNNFFKNPEYALRQCLTSS